MAMLLLVLLSACLHLSHNTVVAQYSPPKAYDGFVYGHSDAAPHPTLLEAFFDFTCPDCLEAWPVIKRLPRIYGPKRLLLIVHAFVLPFHHNSFLSARALHTMKALNGSLVFDWVDTFFANQSSFSNDATWQRSPESVVEAMASLAEEHLGVDGKAFIKTFYTPEMDLATRYSFRFGCSRGVVGTPTFAVNGVTVPGADSSWSIYDWRALLDPLVPPRPKPGQGAAAGALSLAAAGVTAAGRGTYGAAAAEAAGSSRSLLLCLAPCEGVQD